MGASLGLPWLLSRRGGQDWRGEETPWQVDLYHGVTDLHDLLLPFSSRALSSASANHCDSFKLLQSSTKWDSSQQFQWQGGLSVVFMWTIPPSAVFKNVWYWKTNEGEAPPRPLKESLVRLVWCWFSLADDSNWDAVASSVASHFGRSNCMLCRIPAHKILPIQELEARVWTDDLDLISQEKECFFQSPQIWGIS